MGDETNNSLVSLGNLSKPADTLIKKVSGAVGGIFGPYQVVRMAKAEAEAGMIKAQAEIQITELHRRAMHRFVEEEAQRQKNIEEVTSQAIPHLGHDTDAEKMENDWITNFFDKARIVSDADMQDLWARVLAGEANGPGSFSKRTVNLLGDLDKSDAEAFARLCGFIWIIGDRVPLVFDCTAEIYNANGINFNILSHLETIGLVRFNSITGFVRHGLPKVFGLGYSGNVYPFEMSEENNNSLSIGQVLFTKAGQQLAAICAASPIEGFLDYARGKLDQSAKKKK